MIKPKKKITINETTSSLLAEAMHLNQSQKPSTFHKNQGGDFQAERHKEGKTLIGIIIDNVVKSHSPEQIIRADCRVLIGTFRSL